MRATPRKTHKGGHAVYTFVATPRRRAAAEAAAAAAAAEADAPAQPQTAPGITSTCPQAEEPIATEPAANRGAAGMRASRNLSRAESGAAPALQPQQQLSGQQLDQRPSGQQENLRLREPSLDADTNPAMASPALSAITGEAGGAVAGAAGLPAGTGAGPMSWVEDDAQSRPSGGRQHQDSDDADKQGAGTSLLAPQAGAVLTGQQEQRQQGGSGRRMEALQRLRQQGSQRGFGLSSTGALLPSSASAPAWAAAPHANSDSPSSSRGSGENASSRPPPPEHNHHSHSQQGGSDEARSHRASHDNRQHRDVGTSGQHHQGRHAEREENGGSRDGLEASLRSMGERNRRATAGAGGRDEQDELDRHERSDQQASRHAERRPLPLQQWQQQPHAPHPPAERQHAEPHHRERQQQQHHHNHNHNHNRDSVAVDDGHRRPMSAAATLGAGHDHSVHDRRLTAGEGEGNELAGPSGRGHPRPASAFAAAPPAQPRAQEQQQSARAQQLRQSRHPGRRVSSDSESDGSEEDEEAFEEPITIGLRAQEPSRWRPEAAAAPGHQQTGDVWAERRGGAQDEAGRHDDRPVPRQVQPDAPAAAAASRSQPAASSGRPSSSGVGWDHPQALQTRAQQQPAMQPQQEGAASKAKVGAGHKQQQQPRQPQQAEVAASLTAEKMTSILKYLDEVELQVSLLAPVSMFTEPGRVLACNACCFVPSRWYLAPF